MSVSSPTAAQRAPTKRDHLHRDKTYRVSVAHPVADFYQWMSEDEIDALAGSIRECGQEKPICRLPDGRIIDGRNRELACLVAGVEPRYEERDLATEAEIIAHIRVANEFRRHSTESQRAMTAARLANLKRGSNQYAPKVDGAQAPSISQREVAEQFHISRDLVKRGAAVLRSEVKELATAVDEGRLDVTAAARVATLPPAVQRNVVSNPDPKMAAQHALLKYPRQPEEEDVDLVTPENGCIKIAPDKQSPPPSASTSGSTTRASAPTPAADRDANGFPLTYADLSKPPSLPVIVPPVPSAGPANRYDLRSFETPFGAAFRQVDVLGNAFGVNHTPRLEGLRKLCRELHTEFATVLKELEEKAKSKKTA